jgi:exodeoxyribonuclease VII large subunit
MSQIPRQSPGESAAETNQPVFTVGELSNALKRTIEAAFGRVQVRGEISGLTRAASGHVYFALKDADALLDAVCWRGVAGKLALKPEDGMEVVLIGRVSTYAQRSKYQIIVEGIELAGEGALLKLIEERKKRLAAEGLFDEALKKPIPYLPDVIGVVTSPTGAVIRDILHRLGDRFPRHVLLWPVPVQGEGAPKAIAAAIEGFNRIEAGGPVPRPDVLIVARGGGSLEDLMAFNEEIVVRAAAACDIPLISAVGHESDVTLIDFAADVRAPTPSAAAEMAVPVRIELLARIMDQGTRLLGAMNRTLADRAARVEGLGRIMGDPTRMVEEAAQRLDDKAERLRYAAANGLARRAAELDAVAAALRPQALYLSIDHGGDIARGFAERLDGAAARIVADAGTRLNSAANLLESISYRRVLERGYVVARDQAEVPVTSAAATRPAMALSLEFHDAKVGAQVAGKAPPKPGGAKRVGAKRADGGEQGSLL